MRLAFRRLWKSPGFSIVAVITLALAIGANTLTFSALNTFLLRPLPVDRPDRLVALSNGRGTNHSYPSYLDFRDRNRTLSGLVGYRVAPVAMIDNGVTAHVWGYEVTGNYFDVLGVRALLGRALGVEDDQRSSPRQVLVLSYGTWQSRFAGNPGIVGRKVKINGLDFTILGVMPKGFFGTELVYTPEFWVPVALEPQIEIGNAWLDARATSNLWVLGRLKDGITRRQAEADVEAIAAQLGREHSEDRSMKVGLAAPGLIGNSLRGPMVGFASVLMAVAGLVLLIACTNLANLLLARASGRRKEISVCLALGASKWQLVRQLLIENMVLSVMGGGLGLAGAAWVLELMGNWRPPVDIPFNTTLALDQRVLLFTVLATVVTTFLFGLAPALGAARTDIVGALKNQLSSGRVRRLNVRDVLVGAQIAMSVILLVGTVLVLRSLQNALTINLGFNPRHASAVGFDMALHGYDEARGREFRRRLLERVSSLPGIESAAFGNSIPLSLDQSSTSVYAEGKPAPPLLERIHPFFYEVSPGYLRTLQTRLLSGRDFNDADRQGGKLVAIVNRALAERLFPHQDALGRHFMMGSRAYEISGIVEDGKYESLSDDSNTAAVFFPMEQRYNATTVFLARSPLPSTEVIRLIERAAGEMEPGMAFYQADSLEDHLKLPLLPARIAAGMLGAFGLLAVVLAATGVFGVMAYAVSRRTREIGIRVAIGATDRQVLGTVFGRALVLLGGATVAGVVVAAGIARYFGPILYGVSPRDPSTFLFAVFLVSCVTLAACWVPARRALRVAPSAALREE
ncbi:MAG TPA: ABC transporter permease [Bryobacteraceae bacterium]|nr:ABC transporter permease [Bryobacteraceae bacterium]